jgi:ABC-2 type transport system permease protein
MTTAARRLVSLTWTLGLTEWKLRFYGSVLGYFWTLARPFAYFGVVYVVFTEIAKVGNDVKYYGVYILYGLVLFTFFAETTGMCLMSLVQRENLLRKLRFPRIVIPLSVIVTGLLNLLATLVAVFAFTIGNGVFPGWSWLELPVLVALLVAFSTGVGMLLSVLFVRYRDMQPIWEVASQMLFYASPVLYVATMVPEGVRTVYLFNPLAAILVQVRHAIVDPTAPSLADLMGSDVLVLVPVAVALGVLALGLWAFNRAASTIAENL